MEKTDDLKDLSLFIQACDEMLESKFILVDKRIGDVLKSIAKTKQVYNLMAACLAGFNFEHEWKLATSKGRELVLPIEDRKCIAFIFCMLNAIDDNKININEMLQKHFSSDDCISSYKLFCQQIILPFKVQVIGQLYEKQETKVVKREVKDEQNVKSLEIFKRLIFLVKDIKSYVSGVKRVKHSLLTKDEILTLINHFIELCEAKNTTSLPAMVIGIRAGLGADKELMRRMIEIEQIIKEI